MMRILRISKPPQRSCSASPTVEALARLRWYKKIGLYGGSENAAKVDWCDSAPIFFAAANDHEFKNSFFINRHLNRGKDGRNNRNHGTGG